MGLSRIRIGNVSAVNHDSGMVEVTYPDRDDSVTAELPVFSFTDEYKMPQVGSDVLVMHLSNGAEAGVVMGHYWNDNNEPPASGEGVFHKEMGDSYGDCYMHYEDGKLTIYADEIEILGNASVKAQAPSITHDGEVESTKGLSVAKDISAGKDIFAGADVNAAKNMTAGDTITATKDVVGGTKSLATHTHTAPDGKTTPPD